MKQFLMIFVLCGIALGAAGKTIDATIRFDDEKTVLGTLLRRRADFVVIHPRGAEEPGRIPIRRLSYINFRVLTALKEMGPLFDEGLYGEVTALCEKVLSPALAYADLPNNLTQPFTRWMIASYWSGAYDRTVELSDILMRSRDKTLKASAEFYRRLARMELGEMAEMSAFLKTPAATNFYPTGSVSRLYIDARVLQDNGNPKAAIQTASQMILDHDRDPDWLPQADLLCAKLYFDLDMPEAAESVLKDIRTLYPDPGIQKRASAIETNRSNGEEQ